MKKFLLWVITLWLIIFALPFLAVSVKKSADTSEKGQKNQADIDMGKEISVYLSDSGKCVTMPFEEYITGVVCAEMPALFEVEAIKAQAVAERADISCSDKTTTARSVPARRVPPNVPNSAAR